MLRSKTATMAVDEGEKRIRKTMCYKMNNRMPEVEI
jgi:hypothetical protein